MLTYARRALHFYAFKAVARFDTSGRCFETPALYRQSARILEDGVLYRCEKLGCA